VTLLRDFRYALRRLLHDPGFSLVIVATLALGIGATTAIFSIVQAVLLRPLPYPEPDRLVTTFHFYPSLNDLEAGYAVPTYYDIGTRTRLFDSYAVTSGGGVTMTDGGQPERLTIVSATGQYFKVYGANAVLGRTFVAGEDEPGRDHVIVVGHDLWQKRFGGSAAVIGRRLVLDGEPYEVIGVMPEGFRDTLRRQADAWVPLSFKPEQRADDRRTNEFLGMIGRLRAGIDVQQATRDMHAFADQLKKDFPNQYPNDWTINTRSLSEVGRQRLRPALLVLLGAVGVVLLIACTNLANLLLARATGRSRELAIRTAIGATRASLVAQLLSESLVLAVTGGAAGLLIAWALTRVVSAADPLQWPWAADVRLDAIVLVFAAGVSVATGVLFGILPALYASKTDLHTGLREGGRSGTDGPRGLLARRILVVSEVALALTLLVSAGLLVRSFARLVQVTPGFDPSNVLTFTIALPEAKYPTDAAARRFWDEALAQMEAVPGVTAAATSSVLPFSGQWSTGSFTVEGYQPPRKQPGPWGDVRTVSPSYARTMRIRLLKGRFLDAKDRDDTRPVVVVDDEMIRRYWPNQDPIGKRITFEDGTSPTATWIEVVGVVEHTAHEGLDAERRLQLYFSYAQQPRPSRLMGVAVRTARDPERSVNDLRRAVLSVDRDVPLFNVRTMDAMMGTAASERRLSMVLLASFAALALLLAALGIYGVLAYDVTRRTQELGLRMALGARRSSVLTLVLAQGLRIVLAGLVVGLAGALAAARLIESQLFGVRSFDPATYVGVAALLAVVALVATLVPALRATRVDPLEALRYV
jgi:putative ABC transport system permease protein